MSEMQKPFRTLWRFEPELNNYVHDRGAATCNGKIYVIGGRGLENGDYGTFAEVFDPMTNTWGTMPAPPMYFGRYPGVAACGNMLAVGSQNNGHLLLFDTVANSWRAIPQPEFRKNYGLGVVGDKVYILAGSDGVGRPFYTALAYNLTEDQWESPISFGSGAIYRVVMLNGKLYYDTGATSVYEYDPITTATRSFGDGTWDTNGHLGGAVAIGTNIFYFSTKRYNSTALRDSRRSMYILDTLTGTFTKGEHIPISWYSNFAVLLNDRVYLIQEDSILDAQDMISISVEALTTGEETNPEEGEDMYMLVHMKDTSLLSGTRDLQSPVSWQPGKTLFNI